MPTDLHGHFNETVARSLIDSLLYTALYFPIELSKIVRRKNETLFYHTTSYFLVFVVRAFNQPIAHNIIPPQSNISYDNFLWWDQANFEIETLDVISSRRTNKYYIKIR